MAISFTTLFCIPVGGAILSASGVGLVVFFGGVLVVGLGCFGVGRWACLGYKWRWLVVV